MEGFVCFVKKKTEYLKVAHVIVTCGGNSVQYLEGEEKEEECSKITYRSNLDKN